MKKIFIVILIFLNIGSISHAQITQQEINDDVEYRVVDLITSTKLSVNQIKSFDDFTFKNEISLFIIFNENDEFVKQILKKTLFIILKGNDPPVYKY